MKTFYIQIRNSKGHLSFVSSFAANSDQMAFEVTTDRESAYLFEFTHAMGITAMLSMYEHNAQVLHV